MSSTYRDNFGANPPGMDRSFAREDLRIRMKLALNGQPLQKSVNAVSEGLLDLQSNMVKLLEAGTCTDCSAG